MFDDFGNVYLFTWKIEKFSFCGYATGEPLVSAFFDKNVGELGWNVELYPRGDSEENSGYISCFLRYCEGDEEEGCFAMRDKNFEYGFRIEIIGASGQKLNTLEGKRKFSEILRENTFGSSNFLESGAVAQDAKNSHNDTLTVRCYVYGNNHNKKISDGYVLLTKMLIDKVYCKLQIRDYDIEKSIVFPNKTEYKISFKKSEETYRMNIIKLKNKVEFDGSFLGSKLYRGSFVECKVTLLVYENFSGRIGKFENAFTQSAAHLFKSIPNSLPESWDFPLDIISAKLNHYHRNNSKIVTEIICEFLSSNGDCEAGGFSMTNIDTTVKMRPTLHQDLGRILLDNRFCDIKLKVRDEIIGAHKIILVARSPVFSAMFNNNMIEALTNEIRINDIDISTLRLFLEFLYTDTINEMNCEQAMALIDAAEKYEVPLLKEKCSYYLQFNISLENVCDVLDTADKFHVGDLKSAAIIFIGAHLGKVLSSPGWKRLMEYNKDLATEVTSIECNKDFETKVPSTPESADQLAALERINS